jgi:PTS system nitrogen regulatory IIA component
MDIKDFLSPAEVLVDFPAQDKSHLLSDLSARAASLLKLDANIVSREILKREELGSTGIGEGIAIPHARMAHLEGPFGILARLKRPIDFDAIDSQPIDIVFFLLLPGTSQGNQLHALAAVARKLRDKKTLHALRSANSNSALYGAVVSV